MKDINTFLKSDEYIKALGDATGLLLPAERFFIGEQLQIKGNFKNIQIGTFNKVYLNIIHSLESDMLFSYQSKTIQVSSELEELIRREAKPDTGIDIVVEITGEDNGITGNKGFMLKSINKLNADLVFPYYYCDDCNEIYQELHDGDTYCSYCGYGLTPCYNIYENSIYSKQIKEIH